MSDSGRHRGELRAVPDAPPHYLPRSHAINAVERMVLEDAGQDASKGTGMSGKVGISAVGERPGRFGVYGLGGIGKSVLAAAVARSEVIKERFADGVLWLTVGQEPELITLQAQLARAFGHDEVFSSAGEGHRCLRELFADHSVLLVLDDVWEPEHASKLDVVGKQGRLLMTTRNREMLTALGASEYRLDVLPMDQARALLAEWAGYDVRALPDDAEKVAKLCGCLPLALAMIGAMVREGAAWSEVHESLQQADIEEIAHSVQDYPYEDVLRAMEVSVHALAPELRERYVDLAVFGEDEDIPVRALAVLWGMNEGKVRRRLGKLAARSLVIRDDSGQMYLHDLQRMYVRAMADDGAGNLTARHSALVDAYARQCPAGLARGPAGAVDEYFFSRLPVHLLAAGREHELRELLFTYDWLDAKLRAAGAAELAADFERIECDSALALVRDALRLSSHVLSKDANQLPAQLIGRLGYFQAKEPRIVSLLDQVRTRPRHAWLCPLRPNLMPPGGPLLRTFAGHWGEVMAVALSEDGTRALSGSGDRTVKLWDVYAGEQLRTFEGHEGRVHAVTLSKDGTRALSGSQDNTVRLWDVDSGKTLRTFAGHRAPVRAVALSKDGARALSGSDDRTIKLWDVHSGDVLRTFAGHRDVVLAVALSEDGTRALSGSNDRTVKLWDVASGQELRTLEGHGTQVNAVALSADGMYALSGSHDRTIKLWDVASGQELRTFVGHGAPVWSVTLSKDGTRALSGSWDRTVKLWNVASGQELRTFEGHGAGINAVALSRDGARAVSGSWDNTVKLWNVDSGEELRTFAGHGGEVMAVALSTDGTRALSGSADGMVKLWDVDSGDPLRTFEGHENAVLAVALSGDGKRALSGSDDRKVKLWDMDSGEELRTFKGHGDWVRAVALSRDGKRALSGSDDRTAKLWDVESGDELRTFEGHKTWVTAVALSRDGKRALSGSADGTIKLWDVDSGEMLRTFEGHRAPVNAVALSGDGKRALSCSAGGTVKLWDVDSGKKLRTFESHRAPVMAVALSRDGEQALSGSWDNTVKLWDVHVGQTIATFTSDTPIRACALSLMRPNIIIAGDNIGRVHFLHFIEPAEHSHHLPESRPDIGNSGEDTMPMTDQTPRRVFISYTHDSDDHKAGVLALADRLRAEGIDARIDQYEPHPAEGWPRWMQRQIDEADDILAVCTATYRRRFEGNEQPGRGKGGIFESLLALQDLYDNATINEHIIPVLMGSESDEAIPRALRAYTHYRLPDGYEALYRRLTGQPELTRPPIGTIQTLPPRKRRP